MNFYGINAASRETGVHESSLRRWEDMGLVTPVRVDLGKTSVRVYTDEDVDLLKRVKNLIDEGITLRTAFDWAGANDSKEDV